MSQFKSVGMYVPNHVLNNNDLSLLVETNDEWIVSRTGIKQRHIVKEETLVDLAYQAALEAIDKAGIDKQKIDLIIVATFTPHQATPSTASLLQGRLGLSSKQMMAFDINVACSGFVYGISIVDALLKNNQAHCALLVGAEAISKLIDYEDRSTCILFGDGAGAAIIEASKENKILYQRFDSMPDDEHVLYADSYHGEDKGYLKMKGPSVYTFAVKVVKDSINLALEATGLNIDQIDRIILHQANMRITKQVAHSLKIDLDKFYMNIESYGNTSAASIPIALAEMDALGLLKRGQKYLLIGFGAGLTWGTVLIEW